MGRRFPPLRVTVRTLGRTPLFAVTALTTLALGIGTLTAVFSVVNGILLKPLPFDQADRLLAMGHTAPGLDLPEVSQSPATYLTYRADSQFLEEIAVWTARRTSVSEAGEPEEVPALLVTDGFLDVLRVTPTLGRDFRPEDDAPGAPETILISYGYWQRALGGVPGVVGSTLRVSGTTREIIGVLPQDFRFLDRDPAILYPARFDPAEVFMGNFSYEGVARMRPGATQEQVAGEVDRLARVAVDRYPGPLTMGMMDQAQFAERIRPLKEELVGNVRSLLWVLLGTVALVLIVSCANVANLFLVRAEGRVREVAVRTALGAGIRDLSFVFLSETLLLSLAGAALGLGLAWGGLQLLVALEPGGLPRLEEISLDPTVILFTLGVSLLTAMALGVMVLWRYHRQELTPALKEAGRGGSSGRRARRIQSVLVVGQVALALVLLIGSGLMVRSFLEIENVSPGFIEPDEVLTFRVAVPEAVVEDPFVAFGVLEQILRRIRDLPDVVAAGAATSLPLDGFSSNDALFVETQPTDPDVIPPIRRFVWTVPGHFEAMGIPILVGRDLTWEDFETGRRVVLISERLAREVWDDPRRALGDRVSTISVTGAEPIWYEVVGVVGDVRDDGLDQPIVPMVYWPAAQDDMYGEGAEVRRGLTYVVRAVPGALDGLLPRVQEVVWSEAPGIPVAGVRTLGELVDESLARTSFTLVMLGIAATIAILLGAIGLYGVVSYDVSQRRRDIGIRMALGAERQAVGRMIVNRGVILGGGGVVIGLLGALGVTRLMSSLLFGVTPVDAPTYLIAAMILTGLAGAASWIPARRAAGLDPATILREE